MRSSLRPRGPGSHVLDAYANTCRETMGEAVFSRRLERAFDCIPGGKYECTISPKPITPKSLIPTSAHDGGSVVVGVLRDVTDA